MYQLVEKRYWFLLVSAVVIVAGLLAIPVPPGLRLGIDFTSGSTLDIAFSSDVSQSDLRQQMTTLGFSEAIIQATGEQGYFIRTRTLEEETKDESGKVLKPSEKETIKKALTERFGAIKHSEFASVSPQVSQETVRNAVIAVIAAAVGITLYVAYAFRMVPNPFRWSVCALVALIHDLLATLAIFSLAAKFINIEIDAMFITALLAILGYSINDTVVVFDRVRENILRDPNVDLETIVNISILETLPRSMNTSLTTLFAIGAPLLLGGVTTRAFLLALFAGIAAGTYSSIAIAAQLLVIWEKKDWRNWSQRQPKPSAAPTA